MTRCDRRTNARWLVMSASLFVAAACSGAAAEPSSTQTTASTLTATASPIAEPTSTPASSTNPSVTSIDADVIGGGTYPSFTVQAPSVWSSDGHFVTNRTGSVVLGLSVWDVGLVPRNPCHWRGHMNDPGPTVGDLVAALAAQSMRNATTPTNVTLGGYRGQYLEWSVPGDMVVTGDADFAGCDVEPSNGQRDFVSWYRETATASGTSRSPAKSTGYGSSTSTGNGCWSTPPTHQIPQKLSATSLARSRSHSDSQVLLRRSAAPPRPRCDGRYLCMTEGLSREP